MKTVFLGKDNHYDVIYDVVTQVREIENAYGANEFEAPEVLMTNEHQLLSDALFQYKNSPAARGLSVKQVSSKFVNDIRNHLSKLDNTNSANDKKVKEYRQHLNEYLETLSVVQNQLVDVPEWADLRDRFNARVSSVDAKQYPSVMMLTSFMQSLDRADSSQAEKIHKTVDMMVKSYLSLKKMHNSNNKQENQLIQSLSQFLTEDLNIDLDTLKPNEKVIHLLMRDKQQAQAFAKVYGDLKVSAG